jgi:hypothetical protein
MITLCSRIPFGPVHTAHYILKDLKPRVSGARIIPWLPRRLYVLASSPLDIRCTMSPLIEMQCTTLFLSPLKRPPRFSPQVLPCLVEAGCELGGASTGRTLAMSSLATTTRLTFWLCLASIHMTCPTRNCKIFVHCSTGKLLMKLSLLSPRSRTQRTSLHFNAMACPTSAVFFDCHW